MKPTWCTLYSLKAFQQYEKHYERYASVWEISIWQTKQNKTNKQPSFIDRLLHQLGSMCTERPYQAGMSWGRTIPVKTKDLRYDQSSTKGFCCQVYIYIPQTSQKSALNWVPRTRPWYESFRKDPILGPKVCLGNCAWNNEYLVNGSQQQRWQPQQPS
jgi:hypothetical protein